MSIQSIVFMYCMIWWVVFFLALPIGVEIETNKQIGHAESAPKNPYLLHKLLATSLVALLITIIIAYLSCQEYIVSKFYQLINDVWQL